MTVKLKAGVVGYGAMGRNHARVLGSLDGVELVGILDPQVARERDDILSSLEELIAKKPDYCIIATPTIHHEEIALYLSEAKINLLIEKPCTSSTSAAMRLKHEFQRSGIFAAVGYIERYNPATLEAKRRIEEGQLGEIYYVATTRVGPYPGRISDVGVIKDLATHDIDLTQWVTNSSYKNISSISSNQSERVNEDLVLAIGQLNSGVLIQHTVGWLSPAKQRRHYITGENGAFRIDTLLGDLTYYENGIEVGKWEEVKKFRGVREGAVTRYAISKKEPLLLEHEKFRDSVSGKDSLVVTMDEAIKTLDIAEKLSSDSLNWPRLSVQL
jgi:UDP-N-acetylglucosamine 3-dehydrogenase